MLFSSMVFLWIFLPICIIGYFLSGKKFKNIFLLGASLVFYAWGEPKYIFLMLFSVWINYEFGLLIQNNKKVNAKLFLIMAVAINLMLLGYFKYFNFIIENINLIFSAQITTKTVILPIGISFYTFQAMSYVVDVYRSKVTDGKLRAQENFFNLALYVALFPQLIAGPIIKYHEIEKQIKERVIDIDDIVYGLKRFIYGLSKKILISNAMAQVADEVFSLNSGDLGTVVAWVGIICYAMQIYYDFSGYSDMAIGLGRIFGFKFMENFNYPYISNSIQEFWRRWHISLSTWFREYLYIPLGGNKKGISKTYRNLFLVFLATGIWHGASWTFVVWGLFHGFFIIIERMFLSKWIARNPLKILNHIYVLSIVLISWVFFRSNNISMAFEYLATIGSRSIVWTQKTVQH